MHRNCIKIFENKHKTTILHVDKESANIILPYIFNDDNVLNEFKIIKSILAENARNKEKYRKVNAVKTGKVFEMRFKKNNKNDRIYCIEESESGKRNIILVKLFQGKKSNDIPKKIIDNLKKTTAKFKYNV